MATAAPVGDREALMASWRPILAGRGFPADSFSEGRVLWASKTVWFRWTSGDINSSRSRWSRYHVLGVHPVGRPSTLCNRLVIIFAKTLVRCDGIAPNADWLGYRLRCPTCYRIWERKLRSGDLTGIAQASMGERVWGGPPDEGEAT